MLSLLPLLSLAAEGGVDHGRMSIGAGVRQPFAKGRGDGLVKLWEQMAVAVERDVD